jgi:hypothetical protein
MNQDLRNKFAGTSTKSLKKIAQEEDSQINTGGMGDFLPKNEGLNKFRWYPKHPGEETFLKMRCVHWLPKLKDNGELGRTTVPNARIHGGLSRDPIEAYIGFCQENLNAGEAEDAGKLKTITDWKGGLGMATSWIGYADKISKGTDGKTAKQFGLLEINRTVRDGMNKESIIEDEDEAMEIDPFTPPDSGLPVLITYTAKGKKPTDKWKVQLSKNALPLTDKELEKFDKVTPLSNLPIFNYSVQDFEHGIEGLALFDEQNEINLFSTDEFQAILEEIRVEMAGGEETYEEPAKAAKSAKPAAKAAVKTTKVVPVEEEEIEEAEEVVDDELPFEEDAEEIDPDLEEVEEIEEEEPAPPVRKTVAAPVKTGVKPVVKTTVAPVKTTTTTNKPGGGVNLQDLKKRLMQKGGVAKK